MLARFWMIIIAVTLLTTPVIGDEIKIASWNVQNLGETKAGLSNRDSAKSHKTNKTMGKIAEIIKTAGIDLIAIQEYRDHGVEKRVKDKLLQGFPKNWKGVASSNTGGEKYLILYNENTVTPINPKIRIYDDWALKMERLPGYCSFKTKDDSFDFTIITCHNRTWNNGAEEDAKFLDDVRDGVRKRLVAEGIEDNDIIVLGDFNIAADHEIHFSELLRPGIENAISFKTDTMISRGKKSLDNIFYPEGKEQYLTRKDSGVIGSINSDVMGLIVVDKMISDHYPVWVTFEIPKVDNDE